MDIQQSFLKSIKNSEIKREVTFIIQNTYGSKEKKKIKTEIFNKFVDLNKSITRKLDSIATLAKVMPIKVLIEESSPSWPLYSGSIQDTINCLVDISKLRIIVNFEEFDSKELIYVITNVNEISHLIELSFVDHTKGDLNESSSSVATIYVNTVDKLMEYIEDVMLDISMFYTFITTHEINDMHFKRGFSSFKRTFINESKELVQKKDLHWKGNYYSLASFFRSNRNFDFERYIEAWIELNKKITKGSQIPVKEIDLIEQLKRHKQFGELPLKSIAEEAKKMSPGDYFLARIIHIPNSEKRKRQLIALFGGKTVKRGKVKLFPYEQLKLFNRQLEFVNVFKLTI